MKNDMGECSPFLMSFGKVTIQKQFTRSLFVLLDPTDGLKGDCEENEHDGRLSFPSAAA